MGLKSFFAGLLGVRRELQMARLLDGYAPVFSQFGTNVYASDLVQMAVDCIASETSKLQPRHIRSSGEDGEQHIPKSALNRLFRYGPNPLMTTRDFLEKAVWLLYSNFNCFVYPMYELVGPPGMQTREYTGFYPLNPTMATFLQDAAGTLFVKLEFGGGGEPLTVPYADVIHLRKRFSVNNIMGGGLNGQPDNAPLLKVLSVNDTVLQGLEKAVKTSLTLRGILKIKTLLDDDKQAAERAKFEAAINRGSTGILPMDLSGDYIDLKPDPKVIDEATMAFIQNRILNWYGVPLKILSGSFNDDEYQAFYEKTLEPLLLGLGQAFTRVLFTTTELAHGNEIVFYHRDMMYLSTASKLKLLEVAGAQGLLTDDQKLRILGYPPLLDGAGARRTISLNFVSTDIADEYQMTRARTAGALRLPASKEDDPDDEE